MKENMIQSLQFVGAVFAGKDPVKAAQEASAGKGLTDKAEGSEHKDPAKEPASGDGQKK